ncbi:zinc finger MYM-type 1-like [Pelobates cultripes]|uniref:Zinc finger MYM-type 1-like n=2 Tax=Pelobates cultripes TaxID=61616 RepID=A0AAD1RWE6_PELCU|nr:zinc finger MYM-type 1-like [Pelobates cultripes]
MFCLLLAVCPENEQLPTHVKVEDDNLHSKDHSQPVNNDMHRHHADGLPVIVDVRGNIKDEPMEEEFYWNTDRSETVGFADSERLTDVKMEDEKPNAENNEICTDPAEESERLFTNVKMEDEDLPNPVNNEICTDPADGCLEPAIKNMDVKMEEWRPNGEELQPSAGLPAAGPALLQVQLQNENLNLAQGPILINNSIQTVPVGQYILIENQIPTSNLLNYPVVLHQVAAGPTDLGHIASPVNNNPGTDVVRTTKKIAPHPGPNQPEESHTCSDCGNKFKSNSELSKHRLTHSNNNSTQSVSDQPGASSHQKSPATEKAFTCTTCDKTFTKEGSFRLHMDNHKEQSNHMGTPRHSKAPERNKVDELLQKPSHSLTMQEKLDLKRLGPPQPNIAILQTAKDRGKQYNRNFNPQWYKKKSWLCGSVTKSALFCFPCLLFGGDETWTKTGVTDIKHLPVKAQKHEISSSHVENCLNFSMLGTVGTGTQLNPYPLRSVRKHNEEVDKNRHILSKLIDCIRFCGAFELALRSHDESEYSSHHGVFLGLVDLVASLDSAMEQHLKTATVFKDVSKSIQNELLDIMLDVTRQVILQEMKEADFVAIQIDETTDVTPKPQAVLVYRYIHKGRAVERYFGFISLDGSNAETIVASFLEKLNVAFPRHDDKAKLIAQSYDGAGVLHGEDGGMARKIKDVYPNAHYVHCYAHQLDLLIQQAASSVPGVRVFFCNLASIAAYFSRSPKRIAVLDEVVSRRLPGATRPPWNFSIRTANVVLEHRQDLIECFKTVLSRADNFDVMSVSEAKSYAILLEEREFLYFLCLFKEIMPHVDTLYSQLQKTDTSAVFIRNSIKEFTRNLKKIRDSIEDIEGKLPELPANAKYSGKLIVTLNQIGRDVCSTVIDYAKEHFSFYDHLLGASLLATELFDKYLLRFPYKVLDDTVYAYPMLNKERLRTELEIIYKNKEFRSCGGEVAIYSFLIRNDLNEAFNETFTLLKILITTPMPTSESDRCFSTVKKIKTFLQSSMVEHRLEALSMLSVERELVNNIPDFNNRIIEKFAALKNRREHFMYKS